MKLTRFLFLLLIPAMPAFSQGVHSVVFTNPRVAEHRVVEAAPPPPLRQGSATASKGAGLNQGWFSVVDALFTPSSKGVRHYLYDDSTIQGIYSNGNFPIGYHGFGYSFDPMSKIFSEDFVDISQVPGFAVRSYDAYTLDSIAVYGQYRRPNAQYIDTLFIEVVAVYPNTPNAWLLINKNAAWAAISPDSTIRFADAVYDWNRNRVSDSVTGKLQITKILDGAAFADSNTHGAQNGNHFYAMALPSPLSVPAGGKVLAYAHYKSGFVYPFGTLSSAANVWQHFVYELNGSGTLPRQRLNDQTGGLVTDNDDRYHKGSWSTYAGHATLSATYKYTAPAQIDDPYFSFHLLCPGCAPLGLKQEEAFGTMTLSPIPAAEELLLSIRLQKTGPVQWMLSNLQGQTVRSESRQLLLAGQTETIRIPVADLPAGLYLATLSSGGLRRVNKVIIVH